MQKLKLHPLVVVFCLVLCFTTNAVAQKTPYLERLVTIKAYNQPLAEIFKSISSQVQVVFSYTGFDDQQKITASYYKKPLRVVLSDLLKETNCTYKMKDKYVILICGEKPKQESNTMFHLSGYIYNAADSSRVENASLYIRQTKHSANSNHYGYFAFSFPKTGNSSRVSIAKENFKDTTIIIYGKNKQEMDIFISPAPVNTEIYASIDPIGVKVLHPGFEKDTVPVAATNETPVKQRIVLDTSFHNMLLSGFNFWEKLKTSNVNFRNINDTLFQTVSFSLVPYVSTNRLLSINTVNKYSFNLLAGQSKGIDVFEFGALLNIDNGNVRYGQIGGLANVVSGNVLGAQIGGMVNYNGGNMTGFQVGGMTNITRGDVKYMQVGGLVNVVSGEVEGMQIGGFINSNSKSMTGFQVGGLVNVNKGDSKYAQVGGLGNLVGGDFTGMQASGLFNVSRNMTGVQITGIANQSKLVNGVQVGGIVSRATKINGFQLSGLVNLADTVNGAQLAGLVNVAKTVNGFQLSGLVNKATDLNGVQLSLLNFAKRSTGVPIGFFSYVNNGYHKIEIASDELLFGTVAFRTGVNKFHNIFLAGISMDKGNSLWTYGYGIGSAWKLSPKWYLDADITAQHIQSVKSSEIYVNGLSKAFLGVEFRPFQKFSIALGPTYNVFVSDVSDNNIVYNQVGSNPFFNRTEDGINVKMWVGGKVCLRFL